MTSDFHRVAAPRCHDLSAMPTDEADSATKLEYSAVPGRRRRRLSLESPPFHRAVTIFATVDKEYLIMIIPTAKIPSTPHNRPRASAPAAHNKKGDPPDRLYENANY
jgi:hypothetical protein